MTTSTACSRRRRLRSAPCSPRVEHAGPLHDRPRRGGQAGRSAPAAPDLEHRWVGVELRPDRVARERLRPDGARARRQSRRRVRGPGRCAAPDPGARAGAAQRARDRDPGALGRRVEGVPAPLALGRELQPLLPRVAGRAAERAAGRLPDALPLPALGRRDRHPLRRTHGVVPAVLAHARRRRSRPAPRDARWHAGVELRSPLPLHRRERHRTAAGRGGEPGQGRDHDRARRRRPRAGIRPRARVERARERAAARGRARGRGADARVARQAARRHPRRAGPGELRHRRRGGALGGADRARHRRARRRSCRPALVPGQPVAPAGGVRGAARRRARRDPRDPADRARGQRLHARPTHRSVGAAVSQTLAVVGGRTFASVRKHRNYRLYFAGQAVSFTGTWMQQIAASWLVLQMTHSAVAVGALALAQRLPVTVFGLFVGTLIDRLDVRLTAIRCEFLSMITAIALAALTLSGAITVWELYFLAVVQGVINALDAPSRHSLIFQMVGPDDLHNAVSLSSSLGTVARILGPAIGGIVVAFAGAGVCFALNAASFLAVLLSLLALDRSKLRQPARDRTSTLIGGARDGLRYVRRSRRAGVAFAVVFVLATFSFNFNVLLPLVADRTLHQGAQTFGLIAAIFGAGALCGALINATHGVASLRRLLIGAIGFGA